MKNIFLKQKLDENNVSYFKTPLPHLSILIAIFKYEACFESFRHIKKDTIGQTWLYADMWLFQRPNMRNRTLSTMYI